MPAAVKHLIVTSARALPASTVSSCVSAYGLDPDAALVLTHCALAPDGTFAGALAAPQSVDTLVSLADDPDAWHAPEVLAAASRALRPGGSFVAATLVSVLNDARDAVGVVARVVAEPKETPKKPPKSSSSVDYFCGAMDASQASSSSSVRSSP